jgi:hypothetical protein
MAILSGLYQLLNVSRPDGYEQTLSTGNFSALTGKISVLIDSPPGPSPFW